MERKVCTIGEWLDVWYEVYAVPEYAPKTLEIYRDARKRLSRGFPEIESMLLTELLPVTFQKALPSSSATPTRPLRSAGMSTRIIHPSTSKCAVFQAYSSKPATLPLFKMEKPTHLYRWVGFHLWPSLLFQNPATLPLFDFSLRQWHVLAQTAAYRALSAAFLAR